MKKIAIVTGASGGIGQVFVRELAKEALDEIWVVGRSKDRLLALRDEFGDRIIPVNKDLTKSADLLAVSDLLKKQDLSVRWLVNNAGIAKMAPSKDFLLPAFRLYPISIYMLPRKPLSAATPGRLMRN